MSDRIDVDRYRTLIERTIVEDKKLKYRIWLSILDTLVDIKQLLERKP